MDLGGAIGAIADLLAFLVQRLAEAIALPFKFVFSQEYRLTKYKQWEISAWRRAFDAASVIGITCLIAIGAFWLLNIDNPPSPTSDSPRASSMEITSSTNGHKHVTVTLTAEDLDRVMTSTTTKAIFSNAVDWARSRQTKE